MLQTLSGSLPKTAGLGINLTKAQQIRVSVRGVKQVPLTLMLVFSSVAAAQASPIPASLEGLTPKQALAKANQWRGMGGLQSFVTSEAVVFKFPSGQQKRIALPAQQMMIAIAPYINQTHPCNTHYMSGCQGELVGQAVNVLVKNSAGKTVLKRTMRTLSNGFLELWLDRNQTYQVTLNTKGKRVSGTLNTRAGSDTCITTLRLQ